MRATETTPPPSSSNNRLSGSCLIQEARARGPAGDPVHHPGDRAAQSREAVTASRQEPKEAAYLCLA